MNDARIADAFTSLANEAEPRPATWQRVERAIQRRYRLRLFSGIVASAVVVLAVVSVVPRIGDALRNDRFATPGGSETPVTSSRVAFFDDFARYYFSFPSGLQYRGFQDGVPGVSLTTKDDDLTIEVFSQPPVRNIADTTKGMEAEELDSIAGGRAERFFEGGAQSPQRRELYRITWDYGAKGLPKLIILQFMATTTSDEARAKYADLVLEIVRSTALVEEFRPERWLETTIHTPWGRVDPGVRFDDRTRLVAQFMSARADDETVRESGSGTTYAIERYGISPSIFFESQSLQAVPGYVITKGTRTATGDTEFSVHITDGRDEAITVGPNDSGDLKIREVRLV
jgi:hypothetical protein